MSLHLIKPGAVVERVYYSVPEHSTIGDELTWNEAVTRAQAKLVNLIERLTESLAGFATQEFIADTANVQVCIDLRWVVRQPDGITADFSVVRYQDVAQLRTEQQATTGVDR